MARTEEQKEVAKKWVLENRERINANQRKRYQKRKLEKSETPKQRQTRLKAQREYNARNKEQMKAYRAEYYLKNKDKITAKNKEYWAKRRKIDVKDVPLPAKVKIPKMVLIQVLRANPKHYLYNKEVFNWTEKDLAEFKRLTA